MQAGGWSALRLGTKAGIAPNTIGNYLAPEGEFTSKGKQRSAKLTEVERLATALGVSVLDLLSFDEAAPARALSQSALNLAEMYDTLPMTTPEEEDRAELRYWRAYAALRGDSGPQAGRPAPSPAESPSDGQLPQS